MYYTWKNIKNYTKIVNLKYQANVSDVNFELTDGLYSISDI